MATSQPKIPIQIKKNFTGGKIPLLLKLSPPTVTVKKQGKLVYDSNQKIEQFDQGINASYFPVLIEPELIGDWLNKMLEVPFRQVEYQKYGKLMKTPRQTYCYGQYQGESSAKYRGKTFETEPIPDWLLSLKEKIEQLTGRQYNAVILNQYVDGDHHISWHADSEPFLAHQMIASVTLGQERDFQLRKSKDDRIHEISLKNGSLMVFDEGLLHCLPKRADVAGIRYNITFRCVKNSTGIGNYYYYNRGSCS